MILDAQSEIEIKFTDAGALLINQEDEIGKNIIFISPDYIDIFVKKLNKEISLNRKDLF